MTVAILKSEMKPRLQTNAAGAHAWSTAWHGQGRCHFSVDCLLWSCGCVVFDEQRPLPSTRVPITNRYVNVGGKIKTHSVFYMGNTETDKNKLTACKEVK